MPTIIGTSRSLTSRHLSSANDWVLDARQALPELPAARKERFINEYALSDYDTNLLTVGKGTADYFETIVDAKKVSVEARTQFAKQVSNWILGELGRLLNETNRDISSVKITPQAFVELLDLVSDGTLSNNMAKSVFEQMFDNGKAPTQIAEEQGLMQISDTDALGSAVDEAIEANPKAVSEFLDGKEQAIRFLVGQVMRITRGSANPQLATQLLKERLEAVRQSV